MSPKTRADGLEPHIFEKTTSAQAQISPGRYNLTIGLVLLWGLLINLLIVYEIPASSIARMGAFAFTLFFFASSFTGVYMFNGSERPIVSFIGYNLVVIPFGMTIDVTIARVDPEIAMEALQITAVVTLLMMCAGSLFPRLFQKLAWTMFISLVSAIAVEAFELLVLRTQPNLNAWFFAVIFSGYVAFDWGRANQIPKTVDNAVDSAAALYVDIVNLFLRILEILNRLKRFKR